MKFLNHSYSPVNLFILFALIGCAGGEPGSTTATITENNTPVEAVVDHRPPLDTLDWQAYNAAGQPPWSSALDRDWPGEEMGLTGPIFAMGGSGSKTYIAVYDPGGVLIGALLLKEARKNPARLENIIRLASARGNIQNTRTVDQVAARRFLALVQAARQEERP
ncbi:MAG: hypothetical protein WBB23_03555 [Desulforhopalus sp.]